MTASEVPGAGRLWGATAGIAATAAGLAALFYAGLLCSDDTRYLLGALKIVSGEPISLGSPAERRLVFLLPAAFSFALTSSLTASIAIYAAFYVGLVAATFRAGLRLLSPGWAALAALTVAVEPLVLRHSGAVLPDAACSLFLALAMVAMLDWQRCEASGAGPGSVWAALRTGVFSGLALTMKESGLVLMMLPAGWALLVAIRGRLRLASLAPGLALVAGILAVLAIEAVGFRVWAGTWHSSLLNVSTPHDFEGFLDEQGRTPLARMASLYRLLDPISFWTMAAGFAGAAVVLSRRHGPFGADGGWLAVAAFFLWPLLYFTLGSASLRQYLPPVMQARYYAPCAVPGALLACWLASRLVGQVTRPAARRAIVVAMALALLAVVVRHLPDRGRIYFVGSKEAFLFARADARARFPKVPVIDSDTGWTSDLGRCRVLLRAQGTESREDFFGALREGGELGATRLAPVEELEPPFLLVGHGPFWDEAAPDSYVGRIKARVAAHGWGHEAVGRYDALSRRESRRRWWVPREMAARLHLRNADGRPLAVPLHATGDRVQAAELHLVAAPQR